MSDVGYNFHDVFHNISELTNLVNLKLKICDMKKCGRLRNQTDGCNVIQRFDRTIIK